MSPPRNLPVPRLAPANSITLVAAFDAFGRAIDPAWTGGEIQVDTAPEPSDEDLAHRAFARVTREASDDPRGETDDENLPEHGILAALHARRDVEFAARRRWKAAAIAFLRHLHQGRLKPVAMGKDGMVYEVPAHLWAAADADTLFDNGGCLEVRTGRLAVPSRPTMAEDSAIVLVNRNELQGLIAILDGDSPPTAATTTAEGQQVEMVRTGLPGRPQANHRPPDGRRASTAGHSRQMPADPTCRGQGIDRLGDQDVPKCTSHGYQGARKSDSRTL
jgi:hypothetical protein